jgi:hypothetical protein
MIYGVFMVNVGLTKLNNKTISKSIFANVDEDRNVKLSYDALYGEFNIFNQEGKQLEVYLKFKPFDVRVGFENKIFYVNSSIFKPKR